LRTARVFISCGQRNERERKIGLAVEQHFADRGFETYFAEKVHSSEALTEHIFRFLSESEYFVWIDFKREELGHSDFRGALFVGQELAIATFLKLPGIGFVERGVRREGIAYYQIYNAIPFEDGTEIIAALETDTSEWDSESVNELAIYYRPSSTSRGSTIRNIEGTPLSDWYHLEITNRSKRMHAQACLGYVTRIVDRKTSRTFALPTIELMWAGIGDVTANIIAGAHRDLDAFFIIHGQAEIRFSQRPLGTTNPRYHLPPLGPGQYEIEYTMISSNFASVSARFTLEFDGTQGSVRFEQIQRNSD